MTYEEYHKMRAQRALAITEIRHLWPKRNAVKSRKTFHRRNQIREHLKALRALFPRKYNTFYVCFDKNHELVRERTLSASEKRDVNAVAGMALSGYFKLHNNA